ncbi:MAG: flavin reductase family protein [Candidatus Micrarchaeota archaeon]|nr:flavin reductase family protein [Candidatus Micrarchaeota archaeon]
MIYGEGRSMLQEYLYPRQVVLVTASAGGKTNVTAVEWIMPVCNKPPMLALSLSNSSLTLELLCNSMEFVVAIAGEKLKDAALLCGTTSGKFIDKFEEGKLTQLKASKVGAPLIAEAIANIECKMLSCTSAGDHSIVVGEVLEFHPAANGKEAELLLFNRGGKKLFGLKLE